MATTRVVDSTTGQNARSPGTRADDGPDQAGPQRRADQQRRPGEQHQVERRDQPGQPLLHPVQGVPHGIPSHRHHGQPHPDQRQPVPRRHRPQRPGPAPLVPGEIHPPWPRTPGTADRARGVSTGPSPDRLRWFHPPKYSPSTSSNEHQPVTRSSLQVARRVAAAAARWRGRGRGSRGSRGLEKRHRGAPPAGRGCRSSAGRGRWTRPRRPAARPEWRRRRARRSRRAGR